VKLRRNKAEKPPKPPKPRASRPGVLATFQYGSKPRPKRAARARGITATPGVGGAPGAGPARGARPGKDGAAPAGGKVGRPELVKQREALSKRFAELQWDLGGIAYEMGKRRKFKRDVLVKRSDELKKVDAELGQIERVLRMDREGAAGTCPHCGALQARGAVYCWQCGKQLMAKAKQAKPKASASAKSVARRRKASASSKGKAK
jgi:hypothetical protein